MLVALPLEQAARARAAVGNTRSSWEFGGGSPKRHHSPSFSESLYLPAHLSPAPPPPSCSSCSSFPPPSPLPLSHLPFPSPTPHQSHDPLTLPLELAPLLDLDRWQRQGCHQQPPPPLPPNSPSVHLLSPLLPLQVPTHPFRSARKHVLESH